MIIVHMSKKNAFRCRDYVDLEKGLADKIYIVDVLSFVTPIMIKNYCFGNKV